METMRHKSPGPLSLKLMYGSLSRQGKPSSYGRSAKGCRCDRAHRCHPYHSRGRLPHDRHGVRGGRAGHRRPLGCLRGARRDPIRAGAGRRAKGRNHDLRRDPRQRPGGRDRSRRLGPGFLRASNAGDVRLPELHLDADIAKERNVLRHAVCDRSAPGKAQDTADDRHVPPVRRPDRLSSRSAGALDPQRSGAAGRAPDGGGARAVHRGAGARSAQSARLDRCGNEAARQRQAR